MKKIFTISSIIFSSICYSQVQKVEPEFWWSGMKNPELQLLVYGKDINNLQPEFSNRIKIKEVKKVENPNYLFVTIDTNGVQPGKTKLNFKNGNKTVKTIDYEFRQRQQNSANRDSYTSSDVMYLIMPDRFANGNPKNDNTLDTVEKSDRTKNGGRHGGDIAGIVKKTGLSSGSGRYNNLEYTFVGGQRANLLLPRLRTKRLLQDRSSIRN